MSELRQEILEKSHLFESNELARKYYHQSNIDFSKLTKNDFDKLRDMIQSEIDPLLADKTYHMIENLRMDKKIKFKPDSIKLTCSGSYFSGRSAVTFNLLPLFIGFCPELNGCNQTPIIVGFLKWVDSMSDNLNYRKV